ncbi:nucleotidyltransferase domain-containing protein [Candidatus Micrarchaeota archaeon]|nr:nucleotidyltransferase domain-containing protein [Candidatus Micrarchaeota archaeon]
MITKDNNYKVMKLFFDSPQEKIHIRKIARLVGLSAPGVIKIVSRLKTEGLLVSERTDLSEDVSASKNEKFLNLKRCYNFLNLQESGIVGFLQKHYEEPEAIVLFGSYSRGEDNSRSDVDLAVLTNLSKSLDLKKFEKNVGRKINLYEINAKECEKEFLNSLANGIILHGFQKLIL